jgi:hypothetical protein
MATSQTENSLVEVYDAAWEIVGRNAYYLHPDEENRLRLDLTLRIGQLLASGVTDARDLLRRTIQHFIH